WTRRGQWHDHALRKRCTWHEDGDTETHGKSAAGGGKHDVYSRGVGGHGWSLIVVCLPAAFDVAGAAGAASVALAARGALGLARTIAGPKAFSAAAGAVFGERPGREVLGGALLEVENEFEVLLTLGGFGVLAGLVGGLGEVAEVLASLAGDLA